MLQWLGFWASKAFPREVSTIECRNTASAGQEQLAVVRKRLIKTTLMVSMAGNGCCTNINAFLCGVVNPSSETTHRGFAKYF